MMQVLIKTTLLTHLTKMNVGLSETGCQSSIIVLGRGIVLRLIVVVVVRISAHLEVWAGIFGKISVRIVLFFPCLVPVNLVEMIIFLYFGQDIGGRR